MINKLLSAAVKFYLRSQVKQAQRLEVKILGKNRQILTGYIPQVLLKCDRAIYQELHLNQVEVMGTNIGFNLAEVLKQKPFKLSEPIIVEVKLQLDSQDLQASLASPLLQSGLNDLWSMIISTQPANTNSNIKWSSIAIANETLSIIGTYQDAEGSTKKIYLSTEINLANSHTLHLSPIKIIDASLAEKLLDSSLIDLGTDVAIENLTIASQQIQCSGKITINPTFRTSECNIKQSE